MAEPVWLDREIVEEIQADQVRQHGGTVGLRDEGLLESALARPRQKWACGDDPDLASPAGAYGFGICRNHPFIDGNKRTALMAMYSFLAVNGFELEASEPDAVEIVTAVAAGTIAEADLCDWVRSHLVPWRD